MNQIVRKVIAGVLLPLSGACVFAEWDTDDAIQTTGDVLQIALPLTALTATLTLDDPDGRHQLLWSYGATFTLTQVLKHSVQKERPDGSNRLSFPSGHTSSAFSGAAFLAKRYGWDVGVPAYLAASVTGYSRVHANKHDWWDVTAGAALAIGMNELFVHQQNIEVAAFPVNGGFQLALSYQF